MICACGTPVSEHFCLKAAAIAYCLQYVKNQKRQKLFDGISWNTSWNTFPGKHAFFPAHMRFFRHGEIEKPQQTCAFPRIYWGF